MKSKPAISVAISAHAIASVAAASVQMPTNGKSTANPPPHEQHVTGVHTPDLITATSAILFSDTHRVSRSIRMAKTEWTAKEERLYDALVTREALGVISSRDTENLNRLQERRREGMAPPSGEEILQRYQREKLDRGILDLLRRHVRITTLTQNQSDPSSSALLYSTPAESPLPPEGL